MYKLKIKITKDILKKSMYCGYDINSLISINQNCAISLACQEIFSGCHVTSSTIESEDYSIILALLPIKASNFIREFDKNTPKRRLLMDEFEFEVNVQAKAIESININEIKELLKESKTLELIEK